MTLEQKIVLACQDAWKQEGNTTINKMIEWILLKVLPDFKEELLEELLSRVAVTMHEKPEKLNPTKRILKVKNG